MKKILKFILIGLLAAGMIATFFFLWKKSQPKIAVYELVPTDTLTITRKTVATGKVNPRDEVSIVPQLNGIVSKLYKEAGDVVKKNEIIASIRVIPDVSSLNNAELQVDDARLNLELETKNFERVERLFRDSVATAEEYQKVQNAYYTAQRKLAAAEDALEIIKNGVSSKYASYSNTDIRSTVSGMILSVPVKVGNSVIQANNFNAGTTIASVADMKDMLFIGNIDETEVGSIKVGMPLNVSVGAIRGSSFPARLEYISPKSTEENGAILFEIKAAVHIPDGVFVRAGYSANAEIILEEAKDVICVPESVVFFENDESVVYVYTGMDGEQQQFERRVIVAGLSDGMNMEVKEGLVGGEMLKGAQKPEKK